MSREKTKKITSIGGSALIEGIMMRGPKKTIFEFCYSKRQLRRL